MNHLILSDTELELLLEFEKNSSLESLAQVLNKDTTVISRQLKRISEKAEVLLKVSGRWKINEAGRRLNQSTRDFIKTQNAILLKEKSLRLGTNREFAARVVTKDISFIKELLEVKQLSLNAYEYGIENALLRGEIDMGFDCGRPISPEIQFKLIHTEEIAVVASPHFIKKNLEKSPTQESLLELSHISCNRLEASHVMGTILMAKNIFISTNDIASARAMCVEGLGWALLPVYSITQEIKEGALKVIQPFVYSNEQYGVWKLRSRIQLNDEFIALEKWFKNLTTFK